MPFGGVIHGSNPCAVATSLSPREIAPVKDVQHGRPANKGILVSGQNYAPELLLDVWRAYVAHQQAPPDPSFTVGELCAAFYNRQIKEGRAYRTIADDRWRLNQFAKALGDMDSNHCTGVNIFQYLEAKPPGTNRRSHFKTLKKLWCWAVQSGRVDVDPMLKLQPADEWGVNAEHLGIAIYRRLLRVVAGEEPSSRGLARSYHQIPVFVALFRARRHGGDENL